MPRSYVRRVDARHYKGYSEDKLQECLLAIENNVLSQRKASEVYGIPRRTIINRLKAKRTRTQVRPPGFPAVFNEEEESQFSKCIESMGQYGFPLSEFDLRIIVKAYLDKIGRTVKVFKNNLPGSEWVASFLRRHKNLSKRFAANIKRSRAAVNCESLKKFIDNVGVAIEGVPPANIWNFDETNVTDDPGNKKVIIKRGTKYPELIRNSSKSAISLMFCGNAEGEMLPIYVVYKSTCLWTTWTEGGPPGIRYNCSPSGWFDMNIFTDWFQKLLLPKLKSQPGKKVIIGDNLSAHISIDVLKLCQQNNTEFLCLPPNSTHLTQPLDVAYFRPLKVGWRSVLCDWKASDIGHKDTTLPKGLFPRMLSRLMEILTPNSPNNIKAGFKKSGIYPLNMQPLLDRLPSAGPIDKEAINSSFLENLQNKRVEWTEGISQKGRKKLKLVPGMSVAEQLLTEPEENIVQQILSETTGEMLNIMPSTSSRKTRSNDSCSEASDIISLRDSSEGPHSDLENEPPNAFEGQKLDLQPLVREVGRYVVFLYEGEMFPGVITKFDGNGPTISAMGRSLKNWKWPKAKDEIIYKWSDVLGCINPPKKMGRREFYSVPELDHLWGV